MSRSKVRVLVCAVGDVSEALASALATLTDIELVPLADVDAIGEEVTGSDVGFSYAILHDEALAPVADESADERPSEALYSTIATIRNRRVPIAVLFERVLRDDLKKGVFLSHVDLAVDLGEGTHRLADAIERITASLTSLAAADPVLGASVRGVEPIRIGSLVRISFAAEGEGSTRATKDEKEGTAYRMARWRSLIPLDGDKFVQEVRDVVDALSVYPLRTLLPWDPRSSGALPRGLQDVFRQFGSDPGKFYGGSKSPIANAAAAAKLLKAEEAVTGEKDFARWREAWTNGGSPPALLLTGETGVGKSLMAEFIAFLLTPGRSAGATQNITTRDRFVKFNAAGLTLSDFNHYLMGVAPGVWTGIDDAVVGQLARAAHGVFFLDEIGDMPRDAQAAVLTFLDTRDIRPTGIEAFKGYQHIIAATNHDLRVDVTTGAFRQDLLARFPLRLEIPPLRRRSPEDKRRLIDFLAQDPSVNPRRGGEDEVTHFDGGAVEKLLDHKYKNGNFREFAERVHESIRRTRRRLGTVVFAHDVPAADKAMKPRTATTSADGEES